MVIHKVKIPGSHTNNNARTKLIDFGIELHRIDIQFNLPPSTLNLNANANVIHAYTYHQHQHQNGMHAASPTQQQQQLQSSLRLPSPSASQGARTTSGSAQSHPQHNINNRQMAPVKKYLRIKSLDASGAIGMHLLHDNHNGNMNMNVNDTGTNLMGMFLASNNYELIGINNESCRNLSRKRIEAILVKEGAGAGAGDVILLIKEHGNMGMDNKTNRKGRGYGNSKKNKPLATDCCRCSQSGDCKCLSFCLWFIALF